jgi:hypothetical protein
VAADEAAAGVEDLVVQVKVAIRVKQMLDRGISDVEAARVLGEVDSARDAAVDQDFRMRKRMPRSSNSNNSSMIKHRR